MTREEYLKEFKILRDQFDTIVAELNDLDRGMMLFQEIADNLNNINQQISDLGDKLDNLGDDPDCDKLHCDDGDCHTYDDCNHDDCHSCNGSKCVICYPEK